MEKEESRMETFVNEESVNESESKAITNEIPIKDGLEDINIHKQEFKNAKEKVYDQIPITLKTLDIIIVILVSVLVLMMGYFIIIS